MRKLTAVLSILLILLLGFAAWFYLGGTLRCEVYIRTARAADYPEAFGAIAELVASGAAPQTFDAPPLTEDPSRYTLTDITLTLTNRGLFPAEWLHVQCVPHEGDVAVYSLSGEGKDVPARGSAQVNLKLFVKVRPDWRDNPQLMRTLGYDLKSRR